MPRKPRIPRDTPPTRLAENQAAKAAKRAPEFLAALRSLPCAACGAQPLSEAHHLLHEGDKPGLGSKSSDRYAVPLCSDCHRAAHDSGRPEQWLVDTAGVLGRELADSLWAQHPDLDAMHRVLDRHWAGARKRLKQQEETSE